MDLKSRVLAISLILILMVTSTVIPMAIGPDPPVIPEGTGNPEKYGPRVDDLIYYVDDVAGEGVALEAGEIDVMDVAVPRSVNASWLADSKITMGNYSEWGFYEFDLNNQMWPIGHGEMTPVGWTGSEPAVTTGHYWINDTCQRCLDAREFRRALGHLTDRDLMVANMTFFAEPMETFIFPGIADSMGWENPNATVYSYDPANASLTLFNGGFRDYDEDGSLEYSPSHAADPPGPAGPVDMEELPTLQMWIRRDDPDRVYAGELLRDEMLNLGIPLNAIIDTRLTCDFHAVFMYDYHIHTGGWSWGREPDMYCDLFHSDMDIYPAPRADNYLRYHSHELDPVAYDLKNAPNITVAMDAAFEAQEIVHRDVASIPLYTHVGYQAHRTNYGSFPGEEVYAGRMWEGFTNELGRGFSNYWTHLNAHPQGFEKGGTLRQGLIGDVESFNPVSTIAFPGDGWHTKIYDFLLVYDPLNATKYVSWLAENCTVGTWDNAGQNATVIRFNLLPNVLFHDNTVLNASDVAFTFQYLKDQVSPAWHRNVMMFDHATVIDPLTVDIFFEEESVWALTWCMVPILPKHIWEGKDSHTWNPEDHDAVIGSGPFRFYKDGVVGRPDHVLGVYIHLEANPTYFRKYVWPDVCDETHTACTVDGWVDLDDFMEVTKPGNFFQSENPDGTWPDPPGAWGEHCDVNKDGEIGIADFNEIRVHLEEPWPPPWYVYGNSSVQSQSTDMKTASAETGPVIYVDPEISHCPVGSNFTIDIKIANVTMGNSENGVYGWQVGVSFNSSLIEVVGDMEGPWLKSGGYTSYHCARARTRVVVMAFFFLEWPGTGVVGNGTLANVTFHVLAEGKYSLHLYKTKLRTHSGGHVAMVDHTAVDGTFTVAGDGNGDGDVDAYDLFDLSKAYGSDPLKPNWNQYCDFNRDDKVDDSDLSDVSAHFGDTYP